MRFVMLATLLCVVSPAPSSAADEAGWIKDKKGCRIANPNPKPGESVDWSGKCQQGYADGEGVVQFFEGSKAGARYEGELKKGVMAGHGKLEMADGSVYDGDWVDGKPDGFGRYRDAAGDSYVGGWTAGLQDGPGTLTPKDGKRIIGTWRKGQYVGKE